MAFTIRENLSLILSELEWVGTSYDINIENGFAAHMPMKIISNGNIFYSSPKIYSIYYPVEKIHIKNRLMSFEFYKLERLPIVIMVTA